MRPTVITLTGSGGGVTNSDPVVVNWRQSPFNMSLAFDYTGATTAFTVQMTYDAPADYASAAAYNSGAKWFDHPTLAAMTADEDGQINAPVRAIRLQATASAAGSGTLTIIQGQNG